MIELLFFNFDYEKMRSDFMPISKEIVEYVFYPDRLLIMANQYGFDVVDYMDLL
jgi:hypothetical protein